MDIFNQETNTLIKRIGGDDDEPVFDLAIDLLDQMAKWEKNLALENRNTQFNRNAFNVIAKHSDTGQVLSRGLTDPANPNVEVINVQVSKNVNGKYVLPLDLELKNRALCRTRYYLLHF